MYDVIIIGGGPAGLSAGIYAGRGGLDTLILDKGQCGGMASTTPFIENYPGFNGIRGSELVKKMKEQATKYCQIKEFTNVIDITKNNDHIFSVEIKNETLESKNIILATGSIPISLDSKGVKEFNGRGVSYCAICDGNFFIDREVIVIGGGNTAVTEALYLKSIGVNCSLVHRRDSLRCEEQLAKDLEESNIPVYWNCILKEVKGEGTINEVVLYNKKSDDDISLSVNGVFIAIGYKPENNLAKSLGVNCDDNGYIITDQNMATNIEGVYSAGDITGGLKQVVIATGQGATASMNITR